MAQYEHLPIYRKAFDLTVYIENIVKGFSRYHKYTLGTDLRTISKEIVRLIISANSQVKKTEALTNLRDCVEDMKITVRVGKEVKAFKNFNTFKYLMGEILSLSKQSEGWLRSAKKS